MKWNKAEIEIEEATKQNRWNVEEKTKQNNEGNNKTEK